MNDWPLRTTSLSSTPYALPCALPRRGFNSRVSASQLRFQFFPPHNGSTFTFWHILLDTSSQLQGYHHCFIHSSCGLAYAQALV